MSMPKFYNIDPNTCTKEELEEAINHCQDIENEYHDQEQACKIFLNSCYGALANQYYSCSNLDIAESITLQGQDLIKYSSHVVDYYFKEIWHTETDAHKKIATAMKEKFPDFNVEQFLKDAQKPVTYSSLIIYNDTDSFFSDAIIKTKKHPEGIKVKDLYDENKDNIGEITLKGHESVHTEDKCLNYTDDMQLYYGNIKRIIRHKVTKPKWKLKTKTGREIIVTADHSLVVYRKIDNQYKQVVVKPNEILKTDKVLSIIDKE